MSTISLDKTTDVALDRVSVTRTARRRIFRGRRPGTNVLVLGLYGLISLLADFPIWPGDPWRVPTMLGEDIFQTAWFLEWTPYAILHGHNLFESNALNVPVGVDLAQNTGMPLLGILAAPLTLLVNPIASENLLRFLGFVLSAYAAYWVIRKFVSWTPAAFIGGLLYGFSPYMVSQGSIHLNLMFVPLPPLLLYGLFELIVVQRTRPVRRGLLIGATAIAQYFISAEVLATTALVAGMGIFFLFFLCIREVPARYRHALLGTVVALVCLGVAVAYPTWVMFYGSAHYNGPAQGYSSVFNADLYGAFLPTHSQLLAPSHLAAIGSSLVGGQTQENGSYLGFPLILLTIGVVLRYWRKLWPLYLALLAFTSWLLSLGPRLIVDGRVHSLPVDLPFRKLDHLPGIDNILPVRFSLYVVLFIAIILALGLDEAVRERRARAAAAPRTAELRRPWRRRASLGVVGALAVLSVLSLLPKWPYATYSVRINTAERAKSLAVIPTGSVVVTYPYPTTFFDAPMLWQALDGMRFRLVGGYALVPNGKGNASIFPHTFAPKLVESLLVNSVSPVTVPGYPVAVLASKGIAATSVVVDRDGVHGPKITPGTYRGVVIGTDPSTRTFYIKHGYDPIAVHVDAATTYTERWAPVPSLAGVVAGEVVTVTGSAAPGSITPQLVGALRLYLRNAGAQAVIVGLGTTDAGPIAAWFRDALGPPTRAGGGAEIWTHVAVSDRNGA
jgi:hypothetical protein